MATMNLKKIETKLKGLRASKDSLEKKKAEFIRDIDAEIADLTNQIAKYDKIRVQTEKLMKMMEEQLSMADDLVNEEKAAKKGSKAEDEPEIEEELPEELPEQPNLFEHYEG